MSHRVSGRRRFLQTSAALTGAFVTRGVFSERSAAQEKPRSPNERLGVGAVGLRYQGSVITHKALLYGDVVALCDVDRNVREQARASFGSTPWIGEHYRDLVARKDVDVVLIGAPDHWHTPIVIEACRAGKDVYCEKPLTLTIDEGKLLTEVVRQTGRVVQVGSWQRSDHRFRLAVEMVRQGRIGQLQRVEVVLGKNVTGGPFATLAPPPYLNWDLWQGQTPDKPFCYERCHYTFRWWYAYSGGQMTDWGAHHLDIAQWGIGSLPVHIDGQAKFPHIPNGHDVAVDFQATYRYANGVEMTVSDTGRNGVMFIGSEGRIFVNRGVVAGQAVDDLAVNPLPRDKFQVYPHDNLDRPERMGKLDAIINHMGNFFDCVATRHATLSDVVSQHQSAATCHLGNISMRLGRPLQWDPQRDMFLNDAEANTWLSREQRQGYEIA